VPGAGPEGTEGGDMLGIAIAIPGIIVLILVILLVVYLVRRA
jgi:hypothetical protein